MAHSSTIKIGLDSSDVDVLIEKLERATELAGRLGEMWPYFERRIQPANYLFFNAPGLTHNGRKFHAQCEAVHPHLGRCRCIWHKDGDHYSATATGSALWRL